MSSRKHVCPATLEEALRAPVLRVCCVAHMVGLDYGTVILDARTAATDGPHAPMRGVLVRRPHPGARPSYRVPQVVFRRYYSSLMRQNGASPITSTTSTTSTR